MARFRDLAPAPHWGRTGPGNAITDVLDLQAGIGRWRGAFWGHGIGDIALAFSTAARNGQDMGAEVLSLPRLHDGCIDNLFRTAAEAGLNALCAATPVTGPNEYCPPLLAARLAGQARSPTRITSHVRSWPE